MSRAKIGHEFCPMPRKWHAGWARHKSLFARGLRDALFEFADGAPMAVHGEDWLESVCMQLCIDGRDRPNVRKALKAFQASGLIAYDGAGRVVFCFLPGAQLVTTVAPPSDVGPTTVERPSNDRRTTVELPSNIPLESNPWNDSGRVSQTDRRDRQTEETQHAGASAREVSSVQPRPDLIGFRWFAALWGRSEMDVPPLHSFQRAHAWIGARTPEERTRVAEAIQSDEWCRANKHLIDPDHITKRWQRYLGGAPKTVVRADPREAEAKAKLRAKRDWYNEQIRAARDAGDEYTASITAAERDQVLASMQARLAS